MGMAQELLQLQQMAPTFQQVHGKSMSKGMHIDMLGNAGALEHTNQSVLNTASVHGLPFSLSIEQPAAFGLCLTEIKA